MNEFYTPEEGNGIRDDILAAIPRIIDVLGGSLDEMFWTVLRDLQIFAQSSFGSISGAAHPHLAGAFVGGALISNLAYLGKVINKNKVESLSEVLENTRTHFGDKYCYLEYDGSLTEASKQALENYFQEDINNLGRGYLDVSITGTPGDYHLRYKFSTKFTDILKSAETYTDVIARLDLNDKKDAAIKAQLDKMIPEADRNKPITQVRQEFLEKLKKLNQTDLSDVGKVAFDFAGDLSFQFWLVFMVSNMIYDNADTNQWSLSSQISTLAIALGISLVKFGAKLVSHIRDRIAGKKKEKQFGEVKPQIAVEDKSLQHKQYTSLFVRMNDRHNKDKLAHQKLPADQRFTEDDVAAVVLPEKTKLKKFRGRFFSIVKSTAEVEEIIKNESDENKSSFIQKTTALRTAAMMGIVGSFLEWVGGVGLSTLSGVKKVADFFDGTQGGILGIGAFVLGTVLGFTYFNKRIKPGLEEEKKNLRELYKENAWKFELMKDVETENRKLRRLVKSVRPNPENNYNSKIELLPIMKGATDRPFRRLVPSEKTDAATLGKKFGNRASMAVGRMGTGILLFRLLPLALLGVLGISLTATISAVFWPVTIAALVIGAVWAGIYLYKYIEERRLESAKNFINDIDNRIEAEQVANDTYRKQLGLELKSDRYNTAIKNQNLEMGYENDSESEVSSDLESEAEPVHSKKTHATIIKLGKKDLPVREIAKLPDVQPKRLKFWEEPKDVRRDTGIELRQDTPAGFVM